MRKKILAKELDLLTPPDRDAFNKASVRPVSQILDDLVSIAFITYEGSSAYWEFGDWDLVSNMASDLFYLRHDIERILVRADRQSDEEIASGIKEAVKNSWDDFARGHMAWTSRKTPTNSDIVALMNLTMAYDDIGDRNSGKSRIRSRRYVDALVKFISLRDNREYRATTFKLKNRPDGECTVIYQESHRDEAIYWAEVASGKKMTFRISQKGKRAELLFIDDDATYEEVFMAVAYSCGITDGGQALANIELKSYRW